MKTVQPEPEVITDEKSKARVAARDRKRAQRAREKEEKEQAKRDAHYTEMSKLATLEEVWAHNWGKLPADEREAITWAEGEAADHLELAELEVENIEDLEDAESSQDFIEAVADLNAFVQAQGGAIHVELPALMKDWFRNKPQVRLLENHNNPTRVFALYGKSISLPEEWLTRLQAKARQLRSTPDVKAPTVEWVRVMCLCGREQSLQPKGTHWSCSRCVNEAAAKSKFYTSSFIDKAKPFDQFGRPKD